MGRFIAVLLASIASLPAADLRPSGVWMTCAIGYPQPGPTAMGALHYADKTDRMITLRYLAATEMFGAANFDRYVHELGLMVGKRKAHGAGYLSFSIGVSGLVGLGRGKYLGTYEQDCMFFCRAGPIRHYDREMFGAFGVPFEAHAAFAGRFIGLGLAFYGNINRELPVIGIGLALPFGWIGEPSQGL